MRVQITVFGSICWQCLPAGWSSFAKERKYMEEDDVVISDNNAYLMAMSEGSRIEIHAADREKESWTELSETAEAGSNALKVTEATGWQVGDLIAIASTSDE